MALAIINCEAGHLSALQSFFARVYRPGYILAVNGELLRWQFGRRPLCESYNVKLALLDGEVTGCLGYIPVEVSAGGIVMRGTWLANWMVAPEQRRLGIGPLLIRELTREFDVILNVGANEEARNVLSRMGWSDFGQLTRYVCVLDAEAAGAMLESGRLAWPVEATRLTQSSRIQAASSGETLQIVRQFDADATDLWDRTYGANAVVAGARRSVEYLNWRYADHPVFRYRLAEIRRDRRLCGFAVYRMEQVRDLSVCIARLVEFVAEESAGDCVLAKVVAAAANERAVVVDFFTAAPQFGALTARHGFLPGQMEPAAQIPVVFQPIDRRRTGIGFAAYLKNVAQAEAIQQWYITKSDADQDRPN